MSIDKRVNKNRQRREFDSVMDQIARDQQLAGRISSETGAGIIGAAQPPQRTREEVARMLGIPIDSPVQLPASEDHGRHGIVCADIGEVPVGQPFPTHIRISGIVFMLIPPEAFTQGMNQAFDRGVDFGMEDAPRNIPGRDYCEAVRLGFWNDFDPEEDEDAVEVEILPKEPATVTRINPEYNGEQQP